MLSEISSRNRKLIFIVVIILIVVFFVPIWFISLEAPQYRDGLRMYFWLTRITGGGEFDLRNINLLNHYVGMREIRANDFVEFVIMPYILGVKLLGAISTLFYPRLIMVYFGLLGFVSAALAGLYDFYRWEYEFGNNLNPDAAISIPGISFQPPLFGCKAMMNFYTCSWPHAGALLLILAGTILTYIAVNEHRRKTKKEGDLL